MTDQPAIKVGIQLQPHNTSVGALRAAWRRAEDDGVDSIWLWDHLVPFVGDADGRSLDAPTLLGLLAADTSRVQIGILVSPLSFRHPALLARSTLVADEVSGGRVVLGVGAGVFEPDDRLVPELTRTGETSGERFRRRVDELQSEMAALAPDRRVPLMIGGSGPRTALPVVAARADAWNSFGPPEAFAASGRVLDELCRAHGRDPESIERTVLLRRTDDPVDPDAYVAAGATHLIRSVRPPYDDATDQEGMRRLLARRH